jgi:hypothetical protein
MSKGLTHDFPEVKKKSFIKEIKVIHNDRSSLWRIHYFVLQIKIGVHYSKGQVISLSLLYTSHLKYSLGKVYHVKFIQCQF